MPPPPPTYRRPSAPPSISSQWPEHATVRAPTRRTASRRGRHHSPPDSEPRLVGAGHPPRACRALICSERRSTLASAAPRSGVTTPRGSWPGWAPPPSRPTRRTNPADETPGAAAGAQPHGRWPLGPPDLRRTRAERHLRATAGGGIPRALPPGGRHPLHVHRRGAEDAVPPLHRAERHHHRHAGGGAPLAALEHQVGLYANTIALRTQLGRGPVHPPPPRIKASTLEDFKRADYPLDRLVEKLAIPRDSVALGAVRRHGRRTGNRRLGHPAGERGPVVGAVPLREGRQSVRPGRRAVG